LLQQATTTTVSDYLFEGAGQGCTFVLSASFYTQLRKFIITHSELTRSLHYHDWAIYALARAWGQSWHFDQKPSMQYRQHGRNDTGARSSLRGIRRRLSLIRCGWYRAQLITIAQLCSVGAPENPTVANWLSIFSGTNGFQRKTQILNFCVHGGRRRKSDSIILWIAALIGWI
jgi:rhamnosyltransferase